MSVAVVKKTARDALMLWVIVVLGILLFEGLLVRALGEFTDEITELWSKMPLLKNLIKALVGADLAENVSTTSPIMLLSIWSL